MMINRPITVRALVLGALILAAGVRTVAAQDIVLHAKNATAKAGAWSLVSDSTAADGVRLSNPDAGAAKLSNAAASPATYFDVPFTAQTGRAYHLWIRAK